MGVMLVALTLAGCKGSQSDMPSSNPAAAQGDSSTLPPASGPAQSSGDTVSDTPPVVEDPAPSEQPDEPPADEPADPPATPPVDDPGTEPGEPPQSTSGVMLTWVAPTENTDGSALTDLSGFLIHYGTQSDALTSSIAISTPGMLSYFVDGLISGTTYYFGVTAMNQNGSESALSNMVSVTVR